MGQISKAFPMHSLETLEQELEVRKRCCCIETESKMLVADDDPFVQYLLAEMVKEKFGFETAKALDGGLCIDMMEARLKCPVHTNYKLLILDMNMPVKLGSEVALQLRRLENELKAPKIYIVASTSLKQ